MGLFVPSRKVKPRAFGYEPRHYDPTRDESLRRRMRIKSKVRRSRTPLSLVYFVILLVFAIYIYGALG